MIQRTEPDVYLLTDIRFTGYITTYARWVHVTRAAMSDTPVAQLVATDLVETFTAELIAGDMTVLDDRTLRLFDSYADYFTRNLETLLVEAPVLQRRTPNTFPTIVVSHWLLAAEYQLGRLRRYIRDILAKHPEGLTDDKLWRLTGLGMHRHGSVVRARQRAGAVASGRFGVSESQARCIIWVLPEAQS